VDDGCPPEELADSLVDHVAAAEVSAEAEAVLQPRRLSAALARNTLASGAIMLQAWAHAMHRAACVAGWSRAIISYTLGHARLLARSSYRRYACLSGARK
jgi:hypothetical protein